MALPINFFKKNYFLGLLVLRPPLRHSTVHARCFAVPGFAFLQLCLLLKALLALSE